MENKRIRVVDCENKIGSWYANCIGKEYEVLSETPYNYYVRGGGAIKKCDAELLKRIPVPVKIDITDDVLEMLANVSKQIIELNAKVKMALDDIRVLDERTFVLNEVERFYNGGEH